MRLLQEAGHLVRVAVVLAAGVVLFLIIRNAVVPKDFGRYGHFRPEALNVIRAHPAAFAGQGTCVVCHDDQAKERAAGKHAHVACEACHGPQAAHVADMANVKPVLPDVATLCARCHEKNAAKPKSFPQVVTAEHSGGVACNTCHKPHNPQI